MKLRKKEILLTGIAVLLTACSLAPWRWVSNFPRMWPDAVEDEQYSSLGEQIYYAGTGQDGRPIAYTGGPRFGGGMMMGRSQLSCASCHGAGGKGGIHVMNMQVMDAPDIRYQALSEEMEEHAAGEEETQNGHEAGSYDLDLFRTAVVEGKHPDGDSLDSDMPRWKLSDEEVAALFDFIKTLP